MSRTVKVELSDEIFIALDRQAKDQGSSPPSLIARMVEAQIQPLYVRAPLPPQGGLERFFGLTRNGGPQGSDNTRIDADLVRAYSNEQ